MKRRIVCLHVIICAQARLCHIQVSSRTPASVSNSASNPPSDPPGISRRIFHGFISLPKELIAKIARRANSRSHEPKTEVPGVDYFQVFSYVIFFAMVMTMVLGQIDYNKGAQARQVQKENEELQTHILRELLKGEKAERVPWPIIHRQITEIREGKKPITQLFSLYQHVKVFYPDDWLLLIEIGHILKDNNNLSLMARANIKDPMGFRHEVLRHLIFIKHGRRVNYLENLYPARQDEQHDSLQGSRPMERSVERYPEDVKPLLNSTIEDVRRSTMPSDGFDI